MLGHSIVQPFLPFDLQPLTILKIPLLEGSGPYDASIIHSIHWKEE